jgi:predicted MFS family arabinose efflux permease
MNVHTCTHCTHNLFIFLLLYYYDITGMMHVMMTDCEERRRLKLFTNYYNNSVGILLGSILGSYYTDTQSWLQPSLVGGVLCVARIGQ